MLIVGLDVDVALIMGSCTAVGGFDVIRLSDCTSCSMLLVFYFCVNAPKEAVQIVKHMCYTVLIAVVTTNKAGSFMLNLF